ncbi:MAG: hypothetical protein J7K23_06440 [Thermoproteales archaeon]|nr:hypothetical protein [Thermoproteales archaeon]
MSEVNNCKFYKLTAYGARCLLIGVDEWHKIGSRYKQYCKNKGMGCPILAQFLNSNKKDMIYLKEVRKIVFRQEF